MEVQIAACEVNVSVSRLSRACCTLMVASSSPRTLELTAKAHVERHFRVVVVESQVEIFTHAVLNLVCTYSHSSSVTGCGPTRSERANAIP